VLAAAASLPPPKQAAARVRAEVSTAAESFAIPAVPDLIPDGPWKKVPGGVCAAKGFKATGERAGGGMAGGVWGWGRGGGARPLLVAGEHRGTLSVAAPAAHVRNAGPPLPRPPPPPGA
jgi:glutamate N-acetyltransferase/amino-acid N-acetyltransferase